MPRLIGLIVDPPEPVVAGEQLARYVARGAFGPLLAGSPATYGPAAVIVAADQDFGMTDRRHLATRNSTLDYTYEASSVKIRANAVICNPMGEIAPLVPPERGAISTGATERWLLTWVTRDSTGVALGNCRVMVFEVGRFAVGEAPMVAEGISDGSGNFSITVPTNTAYQIFSYKSGSPDVTGGTVQTLTPTQA